VDWLHMISRNMPIFHLPPSGFVRPREEAPRGIEGSAIHLFARQVFTDMQILDPYETFAAFARPSPDTLQHDLRRKLHLVPKAVGVMGRTGDEVKEQAVVRVDRAA
jgi:hypothetical protein